MHQALSFLAPRRSSAHCLAVLISLMSAVEQKGGDKLGYESEAFAIYDTLRSITPPVYTLCIGNAFGEAAMLLAAGAKVGLPLQLQRRLTGLHRAAVAVDTPLGHMLMCWPRPAVCSSSSTVPAQT